MLAGRQWRFRSAHSCRAALASLSEGGSSVCAVICEEKLPDGTWRDLLSRIEQMPSSRPLLVVASRLADADLWGHVLSLGGYDVLAKPFREPEVHWVLESARIQRNPAVKTNLTFQAAMD